MGTSLGLFFTGYAVSTVAFYAGWYVFGRALDCANVKIEKTETINVPHETIPVDDLDKYVVQRTKGRRGGRGYLQLRTSLPTRGRLPLVDPEGYLQRIPKTPRIRQSLATPKPGFVAPNFAEMSLDSDQTFVSDDPSPEPNTKAAPKKTAQPMNVIRDTTTWADGLFGDWNRT